MRRRDVLTALAGSAVPAVASARPMANSPDAVLTRWDHDEHPDLRGVVIRSAGKLLGERYYNGALPSELHDIRSAGKSITSLLIGAARDRRMVGSLSDPVQRYWPAAKGSAIGDVALRDVLTMRSGLAADDDVSASPGNEDKFDLSADPLRFLLDIPRANPPGSRYVYNSMTAYTAGIVVEKATGEREVEFAKKVLFRPLGIETYAWASDVAGHTKGQGNLSLSTRDLATIGQMVLSRGLYSGLRVISPGWIDEILKPRVAISNVDPYADAYGYFWFTKTHTIGGARTTIHFASGNGGNKIYVVPSRGLVVAITSSAYGHGYGQRRSEAILKALLET